MSLIDIFDSHKLQIVRPTQIKSSPSADCREVLELTKHCFANLVPCIDFIELADILQISNRITFTISFRQIG